MLDQDQLAPALVDFVRPVTGGVGGKVKTLTGDASTRRYHRVAIAGGTPPSVVVMELPADPYKPEEAFGGSPAGELPFVSVQRFLASRGIPVPEIFAVDLKRGLLALEDLGDQTLEQRLLRCARGERTEHYKEAISYIVTMQREATARPDQACIAFQRHFDRALFRWELDHFREWLLETDRKVTLADRDLEVASAAFDWLADVLASSPPFFVHRDFQSRNLMVVENERLKIIDFQDALLGPRAYDLVALLRDSYVELALAEVNELLGIFLDTAGIEDRKAFLRLFHCQTVQRKLKDAGRFVYIDRVRGNPAFLRWIPASLRYVRDSLSALPELGPLAEVLARHLPELRLP